MLELRLRLRDSTAHSTRPVPGRLRSLSSVTGHRPRWQGRHAPAGPRGRAWRAPGRAMTMKCPGFTILPASGLRSVASVTPALLASRRHAEVRPPTPGGALLRRPPLRTGLAGSPRTSTQASPGGLSPDWPAECCSGGKAHRIVANSARGLDPRVGHPVLVGLGVADNDLGRLADNVTIRAVGIAVRRVRGAAGRCDRRAPPAPLQVDSGVVAADVDGAGLRFRLAAGVRCADALLNSADDIARGWDRRAGQ